MLLALQLTSLALEDGLQFPHQEEIVLVLDPDPVGP